MFTPTQQRAIASSILTLVAIGGCGSEEPSVPYSAPPIVDSGVVAPNDSGALQGQDAATPIDTGVPAIDSTPPFEATCPPTPPGALPPLSGVYFQTSGAGAATPPSGSGGDPTGTWGATHVAVYLPPTAAGLVMADMSSLSGSSWFSFDGTHYRLALDVSIQLATIIGPQGMMLSQSSVGEYQVSGPDLLVTPACMMGGEGLTTGTPTIQFSAPASATAATFIVTSMTTFGEIHMVVDANRL